jgi:hypothetical protein
MLAASGPPRVIGPGLLSSANSRAGLRSGRAESHYASPDEVMEGEALRDETCREQQ